MYRRLHELCYKSYVPNKKPLINAKQRNKRIQWCKNHILYDIGSTSYSAMKANFLFPLANMGRFGGKNANILVLSVQKSSETPWIPNGLGLYVVKRLREANFH